MTGRVPKGRNLEGKRSPLVVCGCTVRLSLLLLSFVTVLRPELDIYPHEAQH